MSTDARRWLSVYNGSSYVIPSFGAMAIQSIDNDGNLVVGLPTKIGQTDLFFNGFTSIAPSEFGQGTMDFPLIAAYEQDPNNDMVPQAGEHWGVDIGSFYIQRSMAGYRIVGNGVSGRVTIMPMSVQLHSQVKITSMRKNGPYYPGKEVFFDPEAEDFIDGDLCYVLDPNDI